MNGWGGEQDGPAALRQHVRDRQRALPSSRWQRRRPVQPHPHGNTPALGYENQIIIETGVIRLYLTDLFPGSSIGVAVGQPLRAPYLSWLFYQLGLTEPMLSMQGHQMLAQDPAMTRLNAAMLRHIEATLAAGPYLLGEHFTAVVIPCMSLFESAPQLKSLMLITPSFTVSKFVKKDVTCQRRPPFRVKAKSLCLETSARGSVCRPGTRLPGRC